MDLETYAGRIGNNALEGVRMLNPITMYQKGLSRSIDDVAFAPVNFTAKAIGNTMLYVTSKIAAVLKGVAGTIGKAGLAVPILPMPGGAQSAYEAGNNLRRTLPAIQNGTLRMPQRLTKPEPNNSPETQERKTA